MAKKKGKSDLFQGPTPQDSLRLDGLPQTFDVWQVDARELVATVHGSHTWMIVVASRTGGQILAHELIQESPTSTQVWQTLFRAMTEPMVGQPHRPTEVPGAPPGEVCPTALRARLQH